MAAPAPRMHGLTHALGGPDPIPGLGAGGGALEWEDVGTGGPPTSMPRGYLASSSNLGSYVPDGSVITAAAADLSGMAAITNGIQVTTAGTYLLALYGWLDVPKPFSAGRMAGVDIMRNTLRYEGFLVWSPADGLTGTPSWLASGSSTYFTPLSVNDQITMQVRSGNWNGSYTSSGGTVRWSKVILSLLKI